MGRPKKELKQILNKKRKLAQGKVKLFEKGDIQYESLSQLSKTLLKKKLKPKAKTA